MLLGTETNRDLLVAVLRHRAFLEGETTTAFLDEHFADPDLRVATPAPTTVELALLASTAFVAGQQYGFDRQLPSVPVGFSNSPGVRHELAFLVAGEEHRVGYRQGRDGTWSMQFDGRQIELAFRHRDEGHVEVGLAGRRTQLGVRLHGAHVEVHGPGGRVALELLPRFPEVTAAATQGVTLAPMPGSVVDVAVSVGQQVGEGDLLVTVEAMKMEHRVTAPFTGQVDEVQVVAGQQVAADQVLVVVVPADQG